MIAAQHVAAAMPPIEASPVAAARSSLRELARRVADREEVAVIDILSPEGASSTALLHARWTFVWSARIVLYAKDWQVADLLDWSRGRVRSDHRDFQFRIDTDTGLRDRVDKIVRELFADKEWKRPLVQAIRAHLAATDGRRR